MHDSQLLRIAWICSLVLLLTTACTSWLPDAHKPPVQQGNLLDAEKLAQLKIGMNKQQILFLLGRPVIEETFRKERWDYVYYKTQRAEAFTASRLTLYFDGNTLTRIERNDNANVNKKIEEGPEETDG